MTCWKLSVRDAFPAPGFAGHLIFSGRRPGQFWGLSEQMDNPGSPSPATRQAWIFCPYPFLFFGWGCVLTEAIANPNY